MESAFALPPDPFTEEDACAFAMANTYVRIHGENAHARALVNLTAMRGRGNSRGAAFWFKALHAIDALTTDAAVQA